MRRRRRHSRHGRPFLWRRASSARDCGRSSMWLRCEGLVVAFVGTPLVVGAGLYGALAGPGAPSISAAGVVCTLALSLYLLIVRAGRVLVGFIALTGMALAVLVPRVTAEIALSERGHRKDVIVTAVQAEQAPSGRSAGVLCSYAWEDGAPVLVPIRRGCRTTTSAGEHISVLFDPRGVITPRAAGPFRLGRFAVTAALALMLPVLCVAAVQRSYRSPAPHRTPQDLVQRKPGSRVRGRGRRGPRASKS
ncbi:hypothetical protein [Streptomyces tailanensis]|uniref:hypothetical protein n=1 Tax=Streptomyces tailanensis TaxID=2569858 RepID=UPI00122E6D1D|nr:hypothetical protein [Streptomyces tailanensis]